MAVARGGEGRLMVQQVGRLMTVARGGKGRLMVQQVGRLHGCSEGRGGEADGAAGGQAAWL